MDGAYGIVKPHEAVAGYYVGGEGFVKPLYRRQYLLHRLRDETRCYAAVAQLLRERVNAAESVGTRHVLRSVDLRMNHAPAEVEHGRFSEYYVFRAGVVCLLYCFHTPEPHHGAAPVCKQSYEPELGSLSLFGERDEPAFYLNSGHFTAEIAYAVNGGTVYVARREMVEQVEVGFQT